MTSMPIRDATWLTDRYTAIRDWVRTHMGDRQTEALAEALLVQAARLARDGTGGRGEQLPSAPAFPDADTAALADLLAIVESEADVLPARPLKETVRAPLPLHPPAEAKESGKDPARLRRRPLAHGEPVRPRLLRS